MEYGTDVVAPRDVTDTADPDGTGLWELQQREKDTHDNYVEKYTDAYTIDDEYFETPEMGDLFLGAVDCEYLERLDEILSGDDKDAQKAAYYTEKPAMTECGTSDDGATTFVAATVENSEELIKNGWMNGTNIICKISSLSIDGNPTNKAQTALDTLKKHLTETISDYGNLTEDDYFTVSLYGARMNSVPTKWVQEKGVPKDTIEIKTIKYNDVEKYSVDTIIETPDFHVKSDDMTIEKILEEYNEEVTNYDNRLTREYFEELSKETGEDHNDKKKYSIDRYVEILNKIKDKNTAPYLKVAKIANRYRQIIFTSDENGETVDFKWLLSVGDDKTKQVSEKLSEILKKVDNKIYLQIDNTQKVPSESVFRAGNILSEEPIHVENLKSMANGNEHGALNGYGLAMMDATGRFAGTAYIKIDNQWVNLMKALLAEINNTDIIAPKKKLGTENPAFKSDYDPTESCYGDAFFEVDKEIDDRWKIQQEIFGKDYDTLNEWTVTIGDATLFIPPTNITIQSDVQNNSQPLMRARGSMIKNSSRTVRRLQLNIYFCGEDGINGYKYKAKHPNGEETTYYMNGLRAIISEFKFTPYLPIENNYINNVLGIDAVTMQAININAVPNMPKMFQVQLYLNEFDYTTFEPELFQLCAECDWPGNVFAAGINWPTFRYYYQRAIQKGEDMMFSGLEFNSIEYTNKALENRTMLQPMQFVSSKATFYIANTDYLDKLLKKKMEADSGKSIRVNFTDEEKDAIKGMGKLADSLAEYLNSKQCKEKLEYLNLGDRNFKDREHFYIGFEDSVPDRTYDTVPDYSYIVSGMPDEDGGFDVDEETSAEKRQMMATFMDELDRQFKSFSDENTSILGTRYYTKSYKEEGATVFETGIMLDVGMSAFADAHKAEDLKKAVNAYTQMKQDTFFKNNKLFIPLIISGNAGDSIKYSSGEGEEGECPGPGLQLHPGTPDMKFLTWCKERADEWTDPDLNAQEEYNGNGNNGMKKNPTYSSLATIKYDEYETGEYEITGFNINLNNNFSHHYLQDIAGEVCQFLGGSDISFSFSILTEDEKCVAAFNSINMKASTYIKKYRSVLPCFPLKIDSEITRFMGVHEIMVTNVTVSTVDNHPGLYSITLEMQSVDRTLRNREAMGMIEGKNYGKKYGSNITDSDIALREVANYFYMQKVIAQAELYPDLELPTIEEMNDIGYKFVRYKFQDDRVYVDPDFYFLYLAKLSSQMLRDSIVDASKEKGINNETVLEDQTGATITIAQDKFNGFKVTDRNEIAKEQREKIANYSKATEVLQNKHLPENLKDAKKKREQEQELESWDISTDIKVKLMEGSYKKEYDAYVAKLKSAIAKIKEEGDVSVIENEDGTKTQVKTTVNSDGTKKKVTTTLDKDGKTINEKEETIGEKSKTEADRLMVSNTLNKEKKDDETEEGQNANLSMTNWYMKKYDMKPENVEEVFNPEDMKTEEKATEGKWVACELEKARRASVLIDDYLTSVPIDATLKKGSKEKVGTTYDAVERTADTSDSIFKSSSEDLVKDSMEKNMHADIESTAYNTYRDKFNDLKKYGRETNQIYTEMQEDIYGAVESFLSEPRVQKILNLIPIEISKKFIEITKDIVYAAACSASGEKEYSNKQNAYNWRPDPAYLGTLPGKCQDNTKKQEATTLEEAVENAIEFSIFKFKMYDAGQLKNVIKDMSHVTLKQWDEEDKKAHPVNSSHYLLDPYYCSDVTSTMELVEEYKENCMCSPAYATYAFMRQMLMWLQYMLDRQQLPSFNGDLLRGAEQLEAEIIKTMAKIGAHSVGDAKLKKALATFAANAYQLDCGKMWLAALYTRTDGDSTLNSRIEKREYEALNSYVQSSVMPTKKISTKDPLTMNIRKMNLALAALGRMEDFNADGVIQNNPAIEAARNMDEKKFVEAAEDPEMFMKHACHDMIVCDARGRMLRAFPTYYMLFIDEGREIGAYKLHDNFYNSMSILEMEIVKSRKLPADTAHIVMSNFYNTLSTEDEDGIPEYQGTTAEAFGYMMTFDSERSKKAEEIRSRKDVESKIRIRPGARIHIRMGYGSNAAMMPICFNGTIAECNASETVDIIAQGDGIELCNPIFEDVEAQKLTQDDDLIWGLGASLFSNGTTPAKIMRAIMTNVGGIIAKSLKALGNPDWLGTSPYGIYHFGSRDMNFIHRMGEPCQNIYEAQAKQSWHNQHPLAWGKAGSGEFDDTEAPSITFDIFGKSPWDIAHICKSVMPDFIVGVAPFDFRSTLFIGAPRYYYAYSYMNVNGAIHEKRKPYQQYHFYTSASDILANGIVATQRDMKTVALGLYQACGMFNSKEQHKVGPLYADIDIYAENQKTMIVDTQLLGKGVPILGPIGGNLINNTEFFDSLWDDKDSCVSNEKIAWKMTASALRESMMDMYAGDMVVLGDPSIKPHDRMCITDNYEHITGQCLAKEVVHHMSIDTGFITTISPDAIITVDDPFENIINSNLLQKALTLTNVLAIGAGIKTFKIFKNDEKALQHLLEKGDNYINKKLDGHETLKKWYSEGKEKWKNSAGTRSEIKESVKEGASKAKDVTKETGKKVAEYGKENSKMFRKVFEHGKDAMTWCAKHARQIKEGGKAVWAIGAGILTGAGAVAGGATLGAAIVASLPAIAAAAASMIAFEVVSHFVNSQVDRFIKNLEVVHVYPLKRHGRAWTAGLGGSKGLVSGSPSEKEQGALQTFIGSVMGTDDDTSLTGIIKSFIFSDDVMSTASKFRRDDGIVDEDGNPTRGSGTFDAVLKAAASSGSGSNKMKADYRQMQLTPRADYTRGDDVLQSYKYYAMLDPKMYQNDPKLNNMRLISEDTRIKPYMKERFFKIVHETPALNAGSFVDSHLITIKGEQKYIKVIQQQQEPSKANPSGLVYDMPLLNHDAMNVLYEILRRTKNNMPAANSSDPYEARDEYENSFVLLESALRVGDTKSQASTGFSFTLRGVEKAAQPLATAIKDLHEEIELDANGNEIFNAVLFDSKDMGDNKTSITVRMPKVTGANNDKEPVNVQPKDTGEANGYTNRGTVSDKVNEALNTLPEYNGKSYIEMNDNIPYFDEEEMPEIGYKKFSPLDNLGRCGVAEAVISPESMSNEERGYIGSIKPAGYRSIQYDSIARKSLYHRCHLLGHKLTGENANERNLVTGTEYLNEEGMGYWEQELADYVLATGKKVRYRVTPVYRGNELLPRGVLMEAMSEDKNFHFNVYCYNVEPGIEINYNNGDSRKIVTSV